MRRIPYTTGLLSCYRVLAISNNGMFNFAELAKPDSVCWLPGPLDRRVPLLPRARSSGLTTGKLDAHVRLPLHVGNRRDGRHRLGLLGRNIVSPALYLCFDWRVHLLSNWLRCLLVKGSRAWLRKGLGGGCLCWCWTDGHGRQGWHVDVTANVSLSSFSFV